MLRVLGENFLFHLGMNPVSCNKPLPHQCNGGTFRVLSLMNLQLGYFVNMLACSWELLNLWCYYKLSSVVFLIRFYDIFSIFSVWPTFILKLNYPRQRLVRPFKTHQFCKSLLMVSVLRNSCTSLYVLISICHAISVHVLFRWNLATSVCENFVPALPFSKVNAILGLRFMSYQASSLSFPPSVTCSQMPWDIRIWIPPRSSASLKVSLLP